MSYTEFEHKPAENVLRGTLLSLLVVPVGIVVWLIIWNIGFIASIVSFGVAMLAVVLYRVGAGGVIGRAGAVSITLVTLVTVTLAIFVGLVSDVANLVASELGMSPYDAVIQPGFWPLFQDIMFVQGGISENGLQLAIAFGLGLLGCFSVLRSAFTATAPEPAPSPYEQTADPASPAAPAAAPSPYDTLYTDTAAGTPTPPAQSAPILNPESSGTPVTPTDDAPQR